MAATPHARTRKNWLLWLLMSAGVFIFAGANAHLIYVAFKSQPDCVEHLKRGEGVGYSAAKSAC